MASTGKWSLIEDQTEHLGGLWLANPQGSYIARLWTDQNARCMLDGGMPLDSARNVGETIARGLNERWGLPKAQPPAPVKVGDTLHHFDQNRRVYTQPAPGREFGNLIYAGHFTNYKIESETTGAWIIDRPWSPKVGKRLVGKGVWFTDAGKADNIWLNTHRHKLRQLLDNADAAKLRAIANILGYVAEGGTP
jgi:hypothetical protein